MQDYHIGIIGVIAGICTSISFFPQIIKLCKTKKAKDISLYMYIILTTGISLWLFYGILLKQFPIIFANGIALIMCLFVITMKIVYDKRERG